MFARSWWGDRDNVAREDAARARRATALADAFTPEELERLRALRARREGKWIGSCLWRAALSFAVLLALVGVVQSIASQDAIGFGGVLTITAVSAALLAVVNVAFMVVTRPRR